MRNFPALCELYETNVTNIVINLQGFAQEACYTMGTQAPQIVLAKSNMMQNHQMPRQYDDVQLHLKSVQQSVLTSDLLS